MDFLVPLHSGRVMLRCAALVSSLTLGVLMTKDTHRIDFFRRRSDTSLVTAVYQRLAGIAP